METKTKSKSIFSIILSIAFVLALSFVALFAGCGKGNKNDPAATPEGTDANQSQAEAQSATEETNAVCTAIFNANGGEFQDGSDITSVDQVVFNDQNFNFTEDAKTITPIRENYTFVGWATAPKAKRTIAKLTAENTATEVTYYAVWASKDECYCYFSANGGYFQSNTDENDKIIVYQVIKTSEKIESDGAYHFLDSKKQLLKDYTPVREGYEFVGFASTANGTTEVKYFRVHAGEKYKEDFYAIWKEVKTATFDANGGTFEDGNATLSFSQTMENADSVADFNADAKSLVVTKAKRTFLGWSKTKRAYAYSIVKDFTFADTEQNVTYYAIWTAYDKCTVTFDAIGGEIVNGKFVAFEDGDNNGVFANGATTYKVTQNLTVVTNGYYSFKYEANLVSGKNAPTKAGYKFVGWVKCWTENKVVKHTSTPVKYFQVSAQRKVFGYSAVWEKIA